MSFSEDQSHSISLADAKKMTQDYRTAAGSGAFLGGFISKNAVTGILGQAGCTGLRIYNALNEDGNPTFVLVGVKSNGEDITGGELAEYVIGCPPLCPNASELAGTA
ncbi:MAG: hypothetical protein JSW64_10560 [Candidatus Zixiibacteriota bacterium]|nr:MAG: hypothetical protein JSW64_10560 [candidate division Zixibacteria bacterium]